MRHLIRCLPGWVQKFAALIKVMLIEDERRSHWFHVSPVEALICCFLNAGRGWLPKTLGRGIHSCTHTHNASDTHRSPLGSIQLNPLSLIWMVKAKACCWSILSPLKPYSLFQFMNVWFLNSFQCFFFILKQKSYKGDTLFCWASCLYADSALFWHACDVGRRACSHYWWCVLQSQWTRYSWTAVVRCLAQEHFGKD